MNSIKFQIVAIFYCNVHDIWKTVPDCLTITIKQNVLFQVSIAVTFTCFKCYRRDNYQLSTLFSPSHLYVAVGIEQLSILYAFIIVIFNPRPQRKGDFSRDRIPSGVIRQASRFLVGAKTQKILVNFFFNFNMTFLATRGCASDFSKMLAKFKMAARGQLQIFLWAQKLQNWKSENYSNFATTFPTIWRCAVF